MIPTRFGVACCFLFLFFTVTGAHYSNNLIFLFAFILVSFLLIAILQTAKNLRGVEITQSRIFSGFPAEKSNMELLIQNDRNKEKFGIGLRVKTQKDHVIVDELFAKDKKWISHPLLLPNKRGFFSVDRIQVYTDAPYGLFYGWYYLYRRDTGVVYPEPKGLLRNKNSYENAGADFSGLKEFVNGDSIARISWKHSAKRDEWLLKEFKDTTPSAEVFRLSDCPQLNIEDQLSQMCLWLIEAERQQKIYGIILKAETPQMGRGIHHLQSCLYTLGTFQQ